MPMKAEDGLQAGLRPRLPAVAAYRWCWADQSGAKMTSSPETRGIPLADHLPMLRTLALVEIRPRMYSLSDDPEARLRDLELLISGYRLCCSAHSIQDAGAHVYFGFTDWLREHHGLTASKGPVATIREASASADEARTRFWSMLWDYVEEHAAGGPSSE